MATLTESIQGMMTPQLFGALAARTGLPETKVRTGLPAAVNAIGDGLAGKARDPRAMSDVVRVVDATPEISEPTRVLDEGSPVQESSNRLLSLTTPDAPGLIKRLASTLGVGAGTARSLAGAASGVVLAGLRKFSRSRGGVDATALSAQLVEEAPALRQMAPSGASIPDIRAVPSEPGGPKIATPTGLDRIEHDARIDHSGERVERAETRARDVTEPVRLERPAHKRSPLLWLLALIPLVLIGLWFASRSKRQTAEQPPSGSVMREQQHAPAGSAAPSPMTNPPPGTESGGSTNEPSSGAPPMTNPPPGSESGGSTNEPSSAAPPMTNPPPGSESGGSAAEPSTAAPPMTNPPPGSESAGSANEPSTGSAAPPMTNPPPAFESGGSAAEPSAGSADESTPGSAGESTSGSANEPMTNPPPGSMESGGSVNEPSSGSAAAPSDSENEGIAPPGSLAPQFSPAPSETGSAAAPQTNPPPSDSGSAVAPEQQGSPTEGGATPSPETNPPPESGSPMTPEQQGSASEGGATPSPETNPPPEAGSAVTPEQQGSPMDTGSAAPSPQTNPPPESGSAVTPETGSAIRGGSEAQGSAYESGTSPGGGVAPSPQTNPPPGEPSTAQPSQPSQPQPSQAQPSQTEPSTTQPSKGEGGQAGLEFPTGSAEATLLDQVQGGAAGGEAGTAAGVSPWIALDDVQFSSGSAELSPDADAQISNIAQIMETHPDAKLQIGGYTDATGSAQRNRKLSQERADNVRQALIEKGVDASRIRARGYGAQSPVQGGNAQASRSVAARIITQG